MIAPAMIYEVPRRKKNYAPNKKHKLNEESVKAGIEFQKSMVDKFDEFLDIQRRTLELKEEKYKAYMATLKIDLEIKTAQLELIKKDTL